MFLGLRLPVTDAILEIPDKVLKTAAMFLGQTLFHTWVSRDGLPASMYTEVIRIKDRNADKIFRKAEKKLKREK